MHNNVANGDSREIAAFVLGPALAAINGNPKAEFSAKKEQIRLNRVFFDDVSIATYTVLLDRQRSPGFAEVCGLVEIGFDVAERMTIKSGVSGTFVKAAGLYPRDPRKFREVRNIADHVGPSFCSIASDLNVAIIGANPDQLAVFGRFRNRVDGGMHLGSGVIDSNATGFFLLLLLGVIGSEIGRDAIPCVSMVVRAKQELRPDV